MQDKDKTKEEIINELQQLRQRIAEFEQSESERKAAQEALRKNKELNRDVREREPLFSILHNVPYGVMLIDKDGRYLYLNPEFTNITGYTLKDITTGKNWFHNAYPDQAYRKKAIKGWKEDIVEKGANRSFRVVCKNGQVKEIDFRMTLLDDGRTIVILSDITNHRQAEKALKDSQDRFRDLYENAPNAYFSVGADGLIHNCNRRAGELLGYSVEDLVGRSVFELYADTPQGKEKASKIFEKFLTDGTITDEELQMQKKDGTPVWISLTVNTVRDSTGRIIESRSMVVDITRRKRAEEALQRSEEKYRMLFEGAKDAIYITSREGVLLDANQSLLDLFGYTSEDLKGLDSKRTYIDSASRLRFQKEIEKQGSVRDYEMKLRKKDGTEIDCLISATVRRDNGGNIIGYQGIIHDITDYKQTEEKLAYMATHDALTGLPNRILFNDRLTLALVQAQRNQKKLAVMLLDLDHFKDINDTLGHKRGDQLLCEVGNRLIGFLRKSDTIARMGGDEFLLLLQEIEQERYAINIARKLVNAFRKPFVIADHELNITTSLGIAIYPEDGEDIDTLLRNADIAMYNAKQKGRNTYQRYTLTMKDKDRRITGII